MCRWVLPSVRRRKYLSRGGDGVWWAGSKQDKGPVVKVCTEGPTCCRIFLNSDSVGFSQVNCTLSFMLMQSSGTWMRSVGISCTVVDGEL